MSEARTISFSEWYARFKSPMTALDCGEKCAPYNENSEPFCCDTHNAVPTAFQEEWQYLQANTELWHAWQADDPSLTARLQAQTPPGQVLIACLGASLCQRNYRALTCRAFPFFPYISSGGNFIGLSYYWDYEDRCWVISNLDKVSLQYRADFVAVYDELFENKPQEKETYNHFSAMMRRTFASRRRAIPLLHRNGSTYKLSPSKETMRRVRKESLPKYGPYQISDQLPFPGEEGS
jgi:hypothetical protein